MVIWITGLSASGKTSIGRLVYRLWKTESPDTVFIDGDEIRAFFHFDDHTEEGRRLNADRISGLCAWLDSQEINVVCCTMSLFNDLLRSNRETLSRYFEVFLDVPMEVLYRRDNKDLYAPALRGEAGNVVGVDLPFEPPADPDLVIDNSPERDDFTPLAADILARALAAFGQSR